MNEGGYEKLYLTFWSAKQENGTLYSLLSLCKLYFLHCNSKCSCYLSLQFDLLTKEYLFLSRCSSEVPSRSLLYCGMISPSRNHVNDPIYCCISFSPMLVHLVSFCVPSSPLDPYTTELQCEHVQVITCRRFY